MHIGVTLLLCMFILCCTGVADWFCRMISVPAGGVAAICLLCAALSGFTLSIGRLLGCNIASVLLAGIGLILCRRERETVLTVLLAFLCGILGWFSQRTFPKFFDIALLTALPAALLGRIIPFDTRQGLLCTLMAPLFYGLIAAIENWYLFDGVFLSIGNALQLDTQVCGAFALVLLSGVRVNKLKNSTDTQKEY